MNSTWATEWRNTRWMLVSLVLILGGSSGALCTTIEVLGSEAALSPEPAPDRALVYFVQVTYGRIRVYVDQTPAAHLQRKSYVAVSVEPGKRLLWSRPGYTHVIWASWFELKGGRSYLFWLPDLRLDSPDKLSSLVDFHYMTSTEMDLEKPGIMAEKTDRFRIALGLAEDIESVILPREFDNVRHVKKSPHKPRRGYTTVSAGTLAVTETGLTYRSEEQTIEIPIMDIQSAMLGGFRVRYGARAPTPILHVRHGPPEASRDVLFEVRADAAAGAPIYWNLLFATLSEASELCRSPGPTSD